VAVVALSALIGGVGAILNSGIIGGFPPKPRLNNLQIAAATSHVYVDLPAPTPSLIHRKALPPEDIQTLVKRAELLGRIMVTEPVLDRVAARCKIPPEQLSGLGRTTANVPIALTEPSSERRASDIEASDVPYRIEIQGRPMVPIIDVYTQAPTVEAAQCLADQAPVALNEWVEKLGKQHDLAPNQVMSVRTLGPARGAIANGGATVMIAMLTFITMFGLSFAVLLGAIRLRRWRMARAAGVPAPEPPPDPYEDETDMWPHTTRLLPWMLAGFIALLWLTPFNNIALNVSLPIELRLDRLVLPFVALVWLLALAAGGRVAPRLRMTWIHVTIGAFLACAFLSVVSDARYINQSLELQLAIKKLPLIVSYVSLFVIAASAVRRREVHAFMTYTLVLAVIVALGMIFEYRMKQNLFWDYSDKLLPGFFGVDGDLPGGAVDHLGRRVVRGPAEVPLEAVAMLTMALPIALVRILHTHRWRDRILYGLAVCALIAATFATYRKSALIAPVSVVMMLAYFRRRELLKLAPLGMVLLVLVSAISPGAIGSTISQFTRSDATSVPTVSDRASDYDAVRPDVWSHLALGRGYGTYNHDSYRILDSEILTRTIEGGVIGLSAFLMLGIAVVLCSRKTIASRDPESAPVALIGACIAIAFLVLATLFDELSFPHAAYIFLYMVGLETAVLVRRPRREPELELEPEPEEPVDRVRPVVQAPLVSVR
jgi:hypothetical protein